MSEQPTADATPPDYPQAGAAAERSPTAADPARTDDEAPGNFVDDAADDIPEPNEPA